MCAWCKMLFIENIILLKDLNWVSCMSNFDYFLTWQSCAFNHFELKFRKRVVAKIIKNSFIDDDSFKKRTIIFKIILLNKFSKEKKFKFIIYKNLKLFLRKLKLNFIKMNYIKDNNKLDYITKYVKIMMNHMSEVSWNSSAMLAWCKVTSELSKWFMKYHYKKKRSNMRVVLSETQ